MEASNVTSTKELEFSSSLTSTASSNWEEWDFARFTFSDTHGVSRSRIIPKKQIADGMKNGIEMGGVVPFLGWRGEIPHRTLDVLSNIDHEAINFVLMPQENTLQPVSWAGHNKYKVGEVLCEPTQDFPQDLHLNTRFIARRQLQKLHDLQGYRILSSIEMEQFFLDNATLEPLFSEADFNSNLVFHKHEKLLFDIQEKLSASGIEITSTSVEMSPGQFEFTLEPKFGIAGADMAFRCREALIEVGLQHDVQVSFMPKIGAKIFPAGAHFNHSLWTSDGHCAFFDAKDPDKMSEVARHWIGGLQKHARAMTAVLCPTVNCYHRFHRPWTSSHNGWNIASRLHTFRMKVGEPGSTYLENRLPSSASNPYLVMAVNIAAGLDGIQKRIEPVTTGTSTKGLEELPHSLDEALKALEEDDVLVGALGKDFVQMFHCIKNELEIEKLKEVRVTEDRDEDFALERKMYLMTS